LNFEKVIVGGIDDEGKKDPYKITFIYKNGFRDSMGQTKSKYGLSKKSSGDVCSHDSVKGEELYSNCEVDARRDCGRTTTHKYLTILVFTHFVEFFTFNRIDENRREKELIQKITVSVALEVETGNTKNPDIKVDMETID